MTGAINGRLVPKTRSWDVATFPWGTRLRAIDRALLPPRWEGAPEGGKPWNPETVAKVANVNAPVNVDLLVVHTANAVAAAGGLVAVHDFARASLVNLNLALENSGLVRTRVRNVMPLGSETIGIAYDEQPGVDPAGGNRFRAHRRWMRMQSAEIAALRDEHQADLVLMLVGDSASTCGVAYTQRPNCGTSVESGCEVGPGYAAFAFSVTSTACSLSEHFFAHEIGHQFGMEHDTTTTPAQTDESFPWSFGRVALDGQGGGVRTLMPATCLDTCPVQLHFSNPFMDFSGFPGVPTGTTVPHLGRITFNARTAALLAPAMSEFRGTKLASGVFGHGFEALPDVVCNPIVYANCPP